MHHLFFKHTTPRWIIWCCSDKWKKCGRLYSTYLSWKWNCKFLLALFELIVLHWHRNCLIIHVLKMVSSVLSRVLGAGSQTVWVCVVKLTLQAGSLGWITLPNSGVLFTHPRSFLEAGTCFLVSVSCSGYIEVVIVLLKKHARSSQYCGMCHTFCVCTVYSLMLSLILHEMALLLHENWSYWIKDVWCLRKLQNKNFIMVCCTTLWRLGAGKGQGWKTATILLAAVSACP